MFKKEEDGFGLLGILIVIVVLAVVSGAGYFVWSTQFKESSSIKDWLTANNVQSKTEIISKGFESASTAASQNDSRAMKTACNSLKNDIKIAQEIPESPDKELSQQLTESLEKLSRSSDDCVIAIETGNSTLLSSSAQQAKVGLDQLAGFVDAAKVHMN